MSLTDLLKHDGLTGREIFHAGLCVLNKAFLNHGIQPCLRANRRLLAQSTFKE